MKWLGLLLVTFGTVLFVANLTLFIQGTAAVKHVSEAKLHSVEPVKQVTSPSYETGEAIGFLYIPKLEQLMPIFQGTGPSVLAKGVGHVVNSRLPGENGNVILSGHRDTVFRGLQKVELGDQLQVMFKEQTWYYQISSLKIVNREDRTVFLLPPSDMLVLSTCYPFSFIGDASQRYLVMAKRME